MNLGNWVSMDSQNNLTYLNLSTIFVVATRDLHGPDCRVAQIIFRFGSGQLAQVIFRFGSDSTDNIRVRVGPHI
jgi:hypothetical protein